MHRILLVAKREYFAYVSAWGFWLGLLFTPIVLILAFLLPSLIERTQPARYYAVVEAGDTFRNELSTTIEERRERLARSLIESAGVTKEDDARDADLEKFDAARADGKSLREALALVNPNLAMALQDEAWIEIPPPARDIDALMPFLSGEKLVDGPLGQRGLFAVFIVSDDEIQYWSEDVVTPTLRSYGSSASINLERERVFSAAGIPSDILDQTREDARDVVQRSPSGSGQAGEVSLADRAPYIMAAVFSFLLWLLIFSVVNYLLTGTIEERSNKIFDSLLTSVSLIQLMTGKLLGVLFLSFTLIGVWSLSATLFGLLGASVMPPEIIEAAQAGIKLELLVPTLLGFIFGYLMFGAMFLALGSLCDTIQEAQSLLSPIIIIMMIPLVMVLVSLSNPGSPILEVLSWVPLLTPFLLILRMPEGLPFWLIALQIIWMAGFSFFVLWAGTRIYRAGAVHGAGLSEVNAWFKGLVGRKSQAS